MHQDIGNLESNLYEKMKRIKQADDIDFAQGRLGLMIFFLSAAKSILEQSEGSDLSAFVDLFETNSFKFFNEVESLKDFVDECKRKIKPKQDKDL